MIGINYSYSLEDKQKIIGFVIERFSFSQDEIVIFCTNGKEIVLEPYGDCCSQTWFESVYEESALVRGAVITDIEDIPEADLPEFPKDSKTDIDQESISFYGLAITTDKGRAIIDYRNSSNGYYGGCCYVFLNETKVVV